MCGRLLRSALFQGTCIQFSILAGGQPALLRHAHAREADSCFVDTAQYEGNSSHNVANVVEIKGPVLTAASIKVSSASKVEQMAIALALLSRTGQTFIRTRGQSFELSRSGLSVKKLLGHLRVRCLLIASLHGSLSTKYVGWFTLMSRLMPGRKVLPAAPGIGTPVCRVGPATGSVQSSRTPTHPASEAFFLLSTRSLATTR